MKRVIGLLSAIAVVSMMMPRPVLADGSVERQAIITDMMEAGNKIMELAEAFPDKKMNWRPGKGVRSTREVLLHVAGSNYMIPGLLGSPSDQSMEDLMKLEKSNESKEKIEGMLKDSYASASKAIESVSDDDMMTEVDFFGTKMTKRAVMLMLASHSHEHLGQLIAYARVNGIVPPWTARQQEAARKAAAAKKAKGGM